MSTTLEPEAGILWAAALVTSDADTPGRLIMVIHHLIVDGVSWRILTDDLTHAWDQHLQGVDSQLPATGTSVTTWAHALASRATDTDITDQLDYWTDTTTGEDPLLGTRPLDQTTDTRGTADAIGIHLDRDTTTAVLTRLPELLTADVNDILLGTLTVALGAWRARRGIDHHSVLIGLEGHGREETLVPGADLSRSIGWFTTWYPVSVSTDTVDPTTALTDPDTAADAVLRVKEHLAHVPDKGTGYGLLRHLNTMTGLCWPMETHRRSASTISASSPAPRRWGVPQIMPRCGLPPRKPVACPDTVIPMLRFLRWWTSTSPPPVMPVS